MLHLSKLEFKAWCEQNKIQQEYLAEAATKNEACGMQGNNQTMHDDLCAMPDGSMKDISGIITRYQDVRTMALKKAAFYEAAGKFDAEEMERQHVLIEVRSYANLKELNAPNAHGVAIVSLHKETIDTPAHGNIHIEFDKARQANCARRKSAIDYVKTALAAA